MENEFELMDWQDIERVSEQQIREGSKQMAIAKYLLMWSQVNIKKLGGKTNEQFEKETKELRLKNAKDQRKQQL